MLFISLEGGEGAGKTTQAARLADRIEAMGLRCLRVREPGSTALGTDLRKLIKRSHTTDQAMSRAAELFLFAAARSELVTKVIGPEKDDPDLVVVADRYADSTVAYQGYGRGIDIETIKTINALATHGVMPDLTFLLDCPPEIGISRVRGLQLQMPLDAMKTADAIDRNAEGMKFEEEPPRVPRANPPGIPGPCRPGTRPLARRRRHPVDRRHLRRYLERGARQAPCLRQGVA